MAQTLITFEKALKENYLPVWRNQLGVEPSALLSKIKKVPLKSDKIVATAPIGLSGGFGFGAEGQATPASGPVQFERFETRAKDMYVNICISAKAVRLTGSGGAMANALDTEIKAAYETAKWNIGRSLFGNGTGLLTTLSAPGVQNTAKDGGLFTVNDTRMLKEGLIVDVYTPAGASPLFTGRISSIDRAGKNVDVKTISGDYVVPNGSEIYVQNSKGREITGLGAIFENSVASIYGVSKAANPYLLPVVFDAGGVAGLDDGLLTKALRAAKNEKNSNVDMFLCGDVAFDNYVNYLRTNNYRVEDMSHTLNGGFKALKFIFGNRVVDIVNDSFVPAAEMWGVDTSSLELHTQEWNFADLQGGGIFNLMENQSIYRALLANYGDLICTNPGGCVRIYGCA